MAVSIFIKGDNIRECVKNAIRQWAAECPEQVRLFDTHMKIRRDRMRSRNGMSVKEDGSTGNFRAHMEIPTSLGLRLAKMTHKDYNLDGEIMEILAQECPICMINMGGVKKNSSIMMGEKDFYKRGIDD